MTNMEVLKRSYIPVLKDKKIILASILNMICGGILPILSIYILTFISEEIVSGNMSIENIVKIIGIYSIVGLSLSILERLSYSRTYGDFNLIRNLLFVDITDKIIRMDFKYYEDPKMMDKIGSVFEGVSSNHSGIEGIYHSVFSLGKDLLTAVILGVIVSMASPFIVVIILIALFIEFKISNLINKYKFSRREERNNINRKSSFYATTASDFIYGKDMRTYPMKERFNKYFFKELKKFKELLNDIYKKQKKFSYVQIFSIVLADLLSTIILLNLVAKTISISEFIKYLTSVTLLMMVLRGIFLDLSKIRENIMYTRQSFEFLDLDLIEEGGENIDFEGAPIDLKFEDVVFTYPGSDKKIFDGISFEIKKGESLALVGLNGAGKTSLVKLITGLYKPDSGKILYNGIDGETLSQKSKFKMFSVVFQDINPMAFTVAENIAVSRESIDRDRVINSLTKVGLIGKIESLPKGIDQMLYKVIDEDGIVLSGGENQKLIMARALYKKNTSMLILDEPTSSLDALAEEQIYREFESMMDGRTTLFISHRLASTKFCDRIMLINRGNIEEIGTHDELILTDGMYRQMYETQGKYYKEEK